MKTATTVPQASAGAWPHVRAAIQRLSRELYMATAYPARAVGVSLDDAVFERACSGWFATLDGVGLDSALADGFFDGETEGVRFRVSRWVG